jgi:spoIIIJ-associated protein
VSESAASERPETEHAVDEVTHTDAEAGDLAGPTTTATETETSMERLEHEGDVAADYLEELLDIADLDGDLDMDVDGDRAAVSISGGDLRALVGRDGAVLEALQELTRLAVYQETGERSRLMLDIDGFRAKKRLAVEQVAQAAVERAKETGEPQHLESMTPFERKVAHDVVAVAGLTSESEGVEPNRHVVIQPA